MSGSDVSSRANRWVPLDLSGQPASPRWIVRDFFARAWLTIVHAKWGSGKSMLYQTLIGAATSGQTWLGRGTDALERILILDEENPADAVIARLKAAGYDHNRDSQRVRYYNQIGCRLGQDGWGEGLIDVVRTFRPDLVVIDSMFSATVATWSNESINPLFSEVFKPIATRFDCAVWLNHHDRKAGGEMGERASGGDQWLAQADRQIAVDKLADGAQPREPDEDGHVRLTFPIRLTGGKSRQGRSLPETYVSIESAAHPDEPDLPVRMWLEVSEAPPDIPDWGNAERQQRRAQQRPTWYMEAASRVIETQPGIGFNAIYDTVRHNKKRLSDAVALLREEGYVRRDQGERGATYHYSLRPFRDSEDGEDESDLAP